MISWTVLSFLASSFATFSKASFILSKAHSVAFTSVLKMLSYSSRSPPFNAKKACEYNHYHCSTSLAPSTPWLAIHGATGLVFLLAFLSRHPLEASLLLIFRGISIPTSLVCTVLFRSFSITFHDAPFSPQTQTSASWSMVDLLLPPETRCNIAGINWSCNDSSPSFFTTDANCQKLRVFFFCSDCHNEKRAFAVR